jgi:hypothetical protein
MIRWRPRVSGGFPGFGLQLGHYWELSATTTTTTDRKLCTAGEHRKEKGNKII